MENKKKFDKKEYDKMYKKTHYKRFVMDLSPQFMDDINTYSKIYGMNKKEFVTNCINYCINNGVVF